MDYLKLVKAVRMFPRLSNTEVVEVLKLMEPNTRMASRERYTSRRLISTLPNLKQTLSGASCSLVQYLQKQGYPYERGESNELLWTRTPELDAAVREWSLTIGAKLLTFTR